MAVLTRSRAQALQALVVGSAALVALYLAVFAIVGSAMFARAPDRLALAAFAGRAARARR